MRCARRDWLRLMAAQLAVATFAGCGTVLHPERRGQPAGRLDWGVVLLDGLGLIFFFIPGIIAFAVDFTTGAIYLPPEYSSPGVPLGKGEFRKVQAPTTTPSRAEVEAIVSRETGRPVDLAPGKFVSQRLAKLDDFWGLRDRWLSGKEEAHS